LVLGFVPKTFDIMVSSGGAEQSSRSLLVIFVKKSGDLVYRQGSILRR